MDHRVASRRKMGNSAGNRCNILPLLEKNKVTIRGKSEAQPWLLTLVINLLGCVLMGALSQLVESFGFFSAGTRSFIFVGLLGAFTTFSTFGNESVNLLRDGNHLLSFLNIALHIILGIGAIWLGRLAVTLLWK